jgi:hypothetical protein
MMFLPRGSFLHQRPENLERIRQHFTETSHFFLIASKDYKKLTRCCLLQVMRWIQNTEAMLMASFTIPGSLAEAEVLKKEHEQFQVAIEVSFTPAPFPAKLHKGKDDILSRLQLELKFVEFLR